MNKYIIVTLENDIKYAIIDAMEYGVNKYFLVTRVSEDETMVDDEFKVCIYNEQKNYFEKIEDEEKQEIIMSMFEKRLEKQREIDELLNNISSQLIKLRVISTDGFNYTLQDNKGKRIVKNIEFYSDEKPKENSYIYMSENIIKENNIFQYGTIDNLKNIKVDEMIKIQNEEEEYYLQRYYG